MKLSLERKAFGLALLAASFSLGGAVLACRPIQWMTSSYPELVSAIVVSPELAGQGREFFEMSCSECHGDDARGDEGPDLHHLALSNARIARTIRNGIKGQMPTFAKKYNDQQIAALVSYLRSLP